MTKFGDQHTLWPIHPKPFDGEILSSWLGRIGGGLGLSLYQFRKLGLPKTAGESADIDQITNPDFFDALASGTGVSVEIARRTGFVSDEGRVYARLVFNNLEWIAPVSIMDKGRRQPCLPFCPSCLATDRVPYYRKAWRYGFHPVCPEHGLLTNRCPECQQPYMYVGPDRAGGTNLGSGELGICRKCETRFRRTTVSGLDDRALKSVTEIQTQIMAALESGWVEVGNRGPVHICQYLQGLHLLGSLFQNPSLAPAISAWTSSEARMRVPDWERWLWTGSMESRPALIRAWILILATWLAEEWPNRFVAMLKALDLTLSQVLPVDRPFWMVGRGIDELSKATYGRTREEVEAARASLARERQWAPNDAEVKEYMRTGRIPEIKPLSRPVDPVTKELFQAGEATATALTERRWKLAKARKEEPREIYSAIQPGTTPDDPTDDLDDASERLTALAEWRRKKKAKPTSG